MKTIRQVIQEAEAAKELPQLITLWNHIANNKYSYTLEGIRRVQKKLSELALLTSASEIEKGKFYLHLNNKI